MRAAVATAGPEAEVPTCPKWTVRELVRHLGRTQQWSGRALLTDPKGESPQRDEPPTEWDELLAWWKEQVAILANRLRELGPDAPAWVFDSFSPNTATF